MSNRYDHDEEEEEEEEELEDTKALRQRRLGNKKRDKLRRDNQEQRLKDVGQRKPRTKVIYDPDFDEDDYAEYM